MLGYRLFAYTLVNNALRFLYRLDLPQARGGEKGAWQHDDGKQTIDTPELASIDKPTRQPRLGDIAQRDTTGEEGKQGKHPCRQLSAALDGHARKIKRHGEQKDRPAEVVGHHDGRHHQSAAIKEECQQQGIEGLHLQHFAEHAMKEDKRIERSNQQQQSHENHGEVDSCCRHEPLVKPIEGKENDGEERMSRNLEINLLVRHEDERPHIVARHLEVVVEDEPEATFSSVQKPLPYFMNSNALRSTQR